MKRAGSQCRPLAPRVGFLLLLAGSLGSLCGCGGGTHNPAYFPNIFPFGKITETHAKPGAGAYFRDYDPHAFRLEVRPKEDRTNPVRTQYVLVATVYDKNGTPQRKRRVEWLVEGVGSILDVDESGVFSGRGYKVSNKYAVSYTDYHEHTITRGNADPNDDFTIHPGQSWCVVSAAVEGDTHVTVYAPEIHEWDKGKVYVTCHWVDANWVFPPPAAVRAGSEHVLTSKVFRHTNQQPLANYQVRYTILEGPEAVFLPSRTKEFVARTDLSGNAHATIAELAPLPGLSKVGIEIIRPPDPTAPSGSGVPIARGETTVEWLAPSVVLSHTGPPAAGLGQEAAFTTAVANTGKVESRSMTVTSVVPDGFQYLRSTPPAFTDGAKLLTWALGTLPPGQTHTIQTVYRALKPGQITSCAAVQTEEGFKDEKCFTTQVAAPGLKVTVTAPPTGTINTDISYQITVSNTGGSVVENVQLTAQFDPGLEHISKANPVTLNKNGYAGLASLAPGTSQTVKLILTPRQAGQLNTRVTATADGGLVDVTDVAVNVGQAAAPPQPPPPPQGQMSLSIDGPRTRYVGRPAEFSIRVTNAGDVPVTNIVVRDRLPAELSFISAGQGGQLAGNDVVWSVGIMQPKEQKVLKLTANCQKLTPAAVQQASASGDPNARADASAALEIFGMPAFEFKVGDTGDPVEVGKRLTYQITVTNTGSLPANDVEIKGIVPNEMRVIQGNGPTKVNVAGQMVTFEKLPVLQPGQPRVFTIEVEGAKAGDVRFRAELRAPSLPAGPLFEEESSNIVPPAAAPPKL